ncbi:tRNA (N6-threonylcarbamoyladenosine(37)-N6)-methyltransferase TrmO [Chloroflexota bacterium]
MEAGISMMGNLSSMTLKPIGIVRSEIKQPTRQDWWEVFSEVVVNDELMGALDGLEEFSHIIVLYWLHRVVSGEGSLKVHPQGRQELPLLGLFATRTPNRPNPVGVATVRLLQRQGNILRVRGLDAIDGTPVIDIKPCVPGYDSASDARVPSWMTSH